MKFYQVNVTLTIKAPDADTAQAAAYTLLDDSFATLPDYDKDGEEPQLFAWTYNDTAHEVRPDQIDA